MATIWFRHLKERGLHVYMMRGFIPRTRFFPFLPLLDSLCLFSLIVLLPPYIDFLVFSFYTRNMHQPGVGSIRYPALRRRDCKESKEKARSKSHTHTHTREVVVLLLLLLLHKKREQKGGHQSIREVPMHGHGMRGNGGDRVPPEYSVINLHS